MALFERVQRSKAPTDLARAQRRTFLRLSFLAELLYYYQHQETEAPDVLFAQRLPSLVEQLVLVGPQDQLDEKLIAMAEGLMAFVISLDQRQMIINNIGKSSVAGKTLKFVLRLRAEKVTAGDPMVIEFVRHLLGLPMPRSAQAGALAGLLRLLEPDRQKAVVRTMMRSDRLPKDQAEALGRAIGKELDIQGLEQVTKAEEVGQGSGRGAEGLGQDQGPDCAARRRGGDCGRDARAVTREV